MSLGGYKFAGYYVQWDGVMSNTELALLIHKARLKAFIVACARSYSDWHFCKNDGPIDFENYSGVIYNIAGVANDFISFFQYKNENKYIAIMTIPEITSSIFCAKARGQGYYVSGSNRYIWDKRTMFHCASITPFNDVDFWRNDDNYPSGALPMMPSGCLYLTTSSSQTTSTTQGSYSYIAKQNSNFAQGYMKLYFGYAVKESKIISLTTTTADDQTHTDTQISKGEFGISVMGFDAMTLSSKNDNYNLFHASITFPRSSEWENSSIKKTEARINNCVQVLTSEGKMYAETGKASSCFLNTTSFSGFVYNSSNSIPFSSNFITTSENGNAQWEIRTSGNLLTSDGMLSKGIVDIDLIASNNTNGYNSLEWSGSYCNGNYLLACKDFNGLMQTYVGWDASNPDIRLENSWTEYTI